MSELDEVAIYAYDGSVEHALPDAVVFPRDTAEVQAVVRIAHELGVPIIASDISLYWQIFRTLGVEPLGHQGSLLASLQTDSEAAARTT